MSLSPQSTDAIPELPPTQAVILAGGLGVRLRPLTHLRPKPMIEVQGRPFLEFLLEQLREQGIQKALILSGYLAEMITAHFGDGRRYGLRLDYSISSAENETGRRLKLAQDRLDDFFLLLYADNYWPMRLAGLWRHFRSAATSALVTVYRNSDQYTRSCVRVNEQGRVVAYDKQRRLPGLQGVEIGYGFFRRKLISNLPDGNISLEETLFPRLILRRELAAYLTDHRYYSIGSFDRLPQTEAFLKRRPTIILDRDGVLNRRPPPAQYVARWSEFEWLPGALEALRLFNEAGYRVLVASNQAGIGRGVVAEDAVHEVHRRMQEDARRIGGRIDAVYICPHDWNAGCHCRKPRPGMLYQAQRDFQLDLTRTAFIGDDLRDREAAEAAGCPSLLVSPNRSLLAVTRQLLALDPPDSGALREPEASVLTA